MIVTLKEIATISAGQNAPQGDEKYYENGMPFVKAGNLQELIDGKSLNDIQKVSYEVAEEYKLKLFKEGTILFAKSGMSCMKGLVYVLPRDSYVVSHLACVTPNSSLSDYLKYFFLYNRPNHLVKDSAYPSISLADIGDIEIELCSLKEREKIVNQLKKLEQVIKLNKLSIKKYDDLIKARFVEMFSNNNYPILKWCEVFNTTTGRLDSNASVENGKYPFFTCSKDILKIDSYAFDQKALLLAGNNAAGKYDVKYYNGKFNAYQRTYVLGLKDNWSYQLFKYQLEDKLTYLQQQSLGGLTKYLTMKILEQLDFIVPPIEKQLEFDDFVKQVDKSKFIQMNSTI